MALPVEARAHRRRPVRPTRPDLLILPSFTYEEVDQGRGILALHDLQIVFYSEDPRDIPAVLAAFTS